MLTLVLVALTANLQRKVPLNYNRLVPDDTFIGHYMQSQSLTETAAAYDFWSALWLLSVACGRDIYVDRPRAPVFLNLYTILVAESGLTRKSSAIRAALRIAQELLAESKIGIVEAYTTPTALDRYLHLRSEMYECSQCVIAISELAAFMKSGNALPVLLTDLYDCPSVRSGAGSVTHGGILQRDVWVSFYSASTPEWLQRVCSPTVMEGGFTSRCLFIVADEPKARIAWPSNERIEFDHVTALRLVQQQARAYRTITLNENARRVFTEWYRRRARHYDPFTISFETREDSHVLRVAALLCINDGMWVVQAQHISAALRIMAEVKSGAQSMFAANGNRGKWIMGIEALRDALLLNMNNPLPRSKLFVRVKRYMDSAEFESVLDTMHESGAIKRMRAEQDGAGRPTEYIQGTGILKARDFLSRLLDAH
jgi:hypothetical protein